MVLFVKVLFNSLFYFIFLILNFKRSIFFDIFFLKDKKFYTFYHNYFFKTKKIKNFFLFFFDFFWFFFYFKFFFSKKNKFYFKFKQIYYEGKLENFKKKSVYSHFFFSFKFFWSIIRFWLIPVFIFIFVFYYLTYIRCLPANKVIFEWFLIVMFLYWLISGFVFFFKKYQFSKYTSVIQRFWKRSYILFWLIESGVFIVFFYLTMNASEEPVYMYDQIKLYKNHLFSWRYFILKLVPVVSLIFFSFILQLKIKWTFYSKGAIYIFVLTLLLLFVFWLEFYQFFHIINFNGNLSWVYNYEDYVWNLEHEFRRTRLVNNYINICLMAKFWHLVFIFVFWIFFVLRINETKRIRFPLFSANSQNFIILYIMSWLYMYPWLKFIFRGFFDSSYYWFFLNYRFFGLKLFFFDIFLFYFNFFFYINDFFFYFNLCDFFYWIESSSIVNYLRFKKHFLRDFLINSIK